MREKRKVGRTEVKTNKQRKKKGKDGTEGRNRVKGGREAKWNKEASYLFRYGLLTPAIFGVSHLRYKKHVKITPRTAVIKHILADSVRFSFRRLLIYAPIKRNYQVSLSQLPFHFLLSRRRICSFGFSEERPVNIINSLISIHTTKLLSSQWQRKLLAKKFLLAHNILESRFFSPNKLPENAQGIAITPNRRAALPGGR